MLNYFYFTLILCGISAGEDQCNKNKDKPPHLLVRDHILCDYDKTVRPVINNNATSLDIKFFVHHFAFNHQGTLEVTAWLGMKWLDEHLHWDPEQFDNVEAILASTNDIWTPDLSIWNRGTYGPLKLIDDESNCCVIFYHKKVICVTEVEIEAMCKADYRHYPFDVHNCTLHIGSWFHSGEEIDLADTEIMTEMGTFSQSSLNPEWHLVSLTYEKNPGIYKSMPNSTFPSINFSFVVSRNAAVKFAILIVPILIAIGMSLLTLWLDPTSTDRIFISAVNIPIHVLLILNFQWDLPESGPSLSYLIQLTRNSELIVLLTLIETVIVRHLFSKTKESPRFLVNIFSLISTSKAGQLLLFLELNPEGAAENLTTDDSSNLVEINECPKEWFLLGKVIDRLSFLSAIFAHFVMFIYYVSN